MCLYNCIIQTLYVRIQTIYVHIRLCTYNILGCCIDRQYTYDIRTYFCIVYKHIRAYTDADIPYVCCSYTFVCAFVYVRMCLYNCIIQTLYVRIQTTYVHIRMCTYNILGSRIDHPYTDDIRRILTRYTNIYERIYEHIRKAVFYTNALGRTNIQTHTYTFVCVCIRLNYTNTYVRARRLMMLRYAALCCAPEYWFHAMALPHVYPGWQWQASRITPAETQSARRTWARRSRHHSGEK